VAVAFGSLPRQMAQGCCGNLGPHGASLYNYIILPKHSPREGPRLA